MPSQFLLACFISSIHSFRIPLYSGLYIIIMYVFLFSVWIEEEKWGNEYFVILPIQKKVWGVVVRDKTTFSFSLYSLVMFKVKNPQMTLSDSTMAGSISTRNVRMKCIALRKCSANLFFFLRTNVISNVYKFCYSKKLLIRGKKMEQKRASEGIKW